METRTAGEVAILAAKFLLGGGLGWGIAYLFVVRPDRRRRGARRRNGVR
jgi:hypothetical protein